MCRIKYGISLFAISWIVPLWLGLAEITQGFVEDYGNLPRTRALAISPSGKLTARIQHENGKDVFLIVPTGSNRATAATELGDIQADTIYFISDKKVVLTVSDTRRVRGYSGKLNFTASYVYDIASKKMTVLLNKTRGIHPAQEGLGRIIGMNVAKNRVYMPAYSGDVYVTYNLYSVDLDTGKGKLIATGNEHTVDWYVSAKGKVIAREDYQNKRQIHKIVAFNGNKSNTVYSVETPEPNIQVFGKHPRHDSLVYMEKATFYEMDLANGETKKLELSSGEHDIRSVATTLNREVVAIEYDGIRPFYELVDAQKNAHFATIDNTFPHSRVSYLSTFDNGKKMLVFVSGNNYAGSYMVFDTQTVRVKEIAKRYPGINQSHIDEIQTIAYKSRDGLSIPSLLTWPTSAATEKPKQLPLIVLPHGGPEANDVLGFDWLAQFFARSGYLVLQPNFRGSSGFGAEHLAAGYGEWGAKMQSDLVDGVNALVEMGHVNPERVCIVGASYGGYAALAGGAFYPGLYRCVISVAGVSDLNRMLSDDKRLFGRHHFLIRYWEKTLGGNSVDKKQLADISPLNHAENFTAPTLLIHGTSDTVVPIKQSRLMHEALIKAGKESALIEFEDDDHWISTSQNRLEVLKEISDFLQKHNP